MKFNYNDPGLKTHRRELRKNQTDAESLLWRSLRSKQIKNLRFFRQYSVGPYILDFYCPKKRLAIELDGSQHKKARAHLYDQERTSYLESKAIRVIRFWNNEVIQNLEGVLGKIWDLVDHLESNPS